MLAVVGYLRSKRRGEATRTKVFAAVGNRTKGGLRLVRCRVAAKTTAKQLLVDIYRDKECEPERVLVYWHALQPNDGGGLHRYEGVNLVICN